MLRIHHSYDFAIENGVCLGFLTAETRRCGEIQRVHIQKQAVHLAIYLRVACALFFKPRRHKENTQSLFATLINATFEYRDAFLRVSAVKREQTQLMFNGMLL